MMDSIGYKFDPAQGQDMANSMNSITSQYGPLAQQALRILAMRIPSLGGGAPLSNGQPMVKPSMPGMPQSGSMSGSMWGQQPSMGGGDLQYKPGFSADSPGGETSGSIGGWSPSSPNASVGGDHLQSLLEALHRARSIGGSQQTSHHASGASNAGRMSGSPTWDQQSF